LSCIGGFTPVFDRLKERSRFLELQAHGLTHLEALMRPQSVLKITVALARRPTGAFSPAVHPAACAAAHGRLLARMTRAGARAAAPRLGHISQAALDIGLMCGIAGHF
jgi:hypothetical protein